MPNLDGNGPDGKGKKDGRGLGGCERSSTKEKLEKLGKGLGKKRKSGGGIGQGKRLNSGVPPEK